MKAALAVYGWGVLSFLILSGAGRTIDVVLSVLWPVIPIARPIMLWWKT